MIPDAELLSLLCTILTKLDVGEFTVKVCFYPIIPGFTADIILAQSPKNP